MATTIRLTRMGRKQAPFYRLVVCDSRVRRDGAYIESLGHYNPMPDAYELQIDHEKAVQWLEKGAQPTDTARSLLRNEGVLYRWHLLKSGESDVEAKVEAFRTRRAERNVAIKEQSKAKQAAWLAEQEAAAKAKLAAKQAEKAAAEAPAAAAESATEEPAAEANEEKTEA